MRKIAYIFLQKLWNWLEELVKVAQPASAMHEQQKAAITVRCTEDIEASLKSLEDQFLVP